ncbi:hypothetical protein [Micromonospora sp. C41]|uniref:hypothetical protein n=1 Tax=Micromonospora sp. C41 TaxID=2824878 RepID=UPI001B3985D2|nr:hypothetical protein [Micromonospora sp. C41]MBQ1061310.1 hypothetical protein [Micromonospora sp. C41]
MTARRKPRQISIDEISRWFPLDQASYWFGETWCPAVDRHGSGYRIRVVTQDDTTVTKFDYFELDADGVITTAPRGYAKDFKPGQVFDVAAAVERFAAPQPNARRIGGAW